MKSLRQSVWHDPREVVVNDRVICRIIFDGPKAMIRIPDFTEIDAYRAFGSFQSAFEAVLDRLPKQDRRIAYMRPVRNIT